MNKTNPIRQLAAVLLLLMLAFPLSAQEMTDSVRTFRFFAGRDGFYAPGLNNGEELARLFEFVDQYKDMIKGHEMMLYVDGYCNSRGAAAENFRMARIRSKRVKSELITRKGLTEDCFSTRNHTEQGDFVLVRAFIPEALRRPRPQPEEKKEVREDTVPQVPEVILPQEQPVDTVVVAEVVEEFDSAAVSPARQSPSMSQKTTVSSCSRLTFSTTPFSCSTWKVSGSLPTVCRWRSNCRGLGMPSVLPTKYIALAQSSPKCAIGL